MSNLIKLTNNGNNTDFKREVITFKGTSLYTVCNNIDVNKAT